MGSRWSEPAGRPGAAVVAALSALVLAATARPSSAQTQTVWELGPEVVATAAKRSAVVIGPAVAVRPSSRIRVSLAALAGTSVRELAWRGELLGHFLLSPAKQRGVGVYGVGGVAAIGGGGDGATERGYLVLALGAESRPAAPSGWMVEAGVGGGARLAAGYRFRWRHRP